MNSFLKYGKLLFLFFLPLTGFGQVSIDDKWSYQFIEESCMVLPMHAENEFKDQDILNGNHDKQFSPLSIKNITGKETYNWLKISIKNESSLAQTLYIGTTRFEKIWFWSKIDTSFVGPLINGQDIELYEKPVKIRGLSFFNIVLDINQSADLYLKVVNKNAPITPQQVIPLIVANEQYFHNNYEKTGDFTYLFMGAIGIMLLYNLLLLIMTRQKTFLYYSGYVVFVSIFVLGLIPQFAFPLYGHMDINQFPISTAGTISTIFYILVAKEIMEIKKYYPKVNKFLNILIILLLIALLSVFKSFVTISSFLNFIAAFSMYPTIFVIGIMMVRKTHIPSTFFFIAVLLFFAGVMTLLLTLTNVLPPVIFGLSGITIYQLGIVAELALFSLGIGVRINEITDVKHQEEFERFRAQQLLVENKEINLQRNNAEKALKELKFTQDQLILKEKLASLGELTAGIAHEIQNPLNFVHNFSELSIDISNELKVEIEKVHLPEKEQAIVTELIVDLVSNQEKINFHSKRASSIVKGMLEHSRSSKGDSELTDINILAEEYLRLSYHGLRAKNKNFNADFKTYFAADLPPIEVISQDISRVFLNIFNNAFFAVNEKKMSSKDPDYRPAVTVSTSQKDNNIEVVIKDNGTGITDKVKEKIFQPFFTTKSTGEGTGLGLSLAYDIIVKGHGGELKVDTVVGEGTSFIIILPIKNDKLSS